MTARLRVSFADLASALAPFQHFLKSKRHKEGEALVGFGDGMLRIEAAGIVGKAPAEGEWPGEARVKRTLILALAHEKRTDGFVEFRVVEGQLAIDLAGSVLRLPCAWETSSRADIVIPLNAALRDVLAVAFAYTSEEIERAGVREAVEQALDKYERIVANASTALSAVGISRGEVDAFVRSKIKP
jgi:hypothetical protein